MRNRRVQRPPSFCEIQVALEVSGTRRQMNYSAGLFSESKNNNNGYAYVGKSVGLGVSTLVEKRAATHQREEARGQQRSSLVGMKRTPLPAAHMHTDVPSAKCKAPTGGRRESTTCMGEINSCQR